MFVGGDITERLPRIIDKVFRPAHGACRANDTARELERLHGLVRYFEIVYPAPGFAAAYGELESLLRKQGSPIPVMVLLIAALVKSHGGTLLTRDLDHFSRIPDMPVEAF